MLFVGEKTAAKELQSNPFHNRIGNQIKRIIPTLFQEGLGHGPFDGTWAIALQTPPPAKGPNGL